MMEQVDQDRDKATGGWDAAPSEPAIADPAELSEWRDLRATVRMLAASEGWSMAEVARRSGLKQGTFSPWYAGKYGAAYTNVTAAVKTWIRSDEDARRMAAAIRPPSFVMTPTAEEVLDALLYAQQLPGIALVTLGPGMGKTMAIAHAIETRPNTFAVTASPSVRTVSSINREIVNALGLVSHPRDVRSKIGERLRRAVRPLLIVDEAQNLGDEAVDELRHYKDCFGCGLALLGNRDVIGRWGRAKPREGYGQLQRRISVRVDRLKPQAADIEQYVKAWGIKDEKIQKLLRAIGQKPGALGQIAETLQLAALRARMAKRELDADDVRRAWAGRADDGEL